MKEFNINFTNFAQTLIKESFSSLQLPENVILMRGKNEYIHYIHTSVFYLNGS